jgi:hypothetical protein
VYRIHKITNVKGCVTKIKASLQLSLVKLKRKFSLSYTYTHTYIDTCIHIHVYNIFFSGATVQGGPGPPHSWVFYKWHTAVRRTPLDEWSARRRDLTAHNTHNHASGGIQTRNHSKRSALDNCLRPICPWEWHTRTHTLHTHGFVDTRVYKDSYIQRYISVIILYEPQRRFTSNCILHRYLLKARDCVSAHLRLCASFCHWLSSPRNS